MFEGECLSSWPTLIVFCKRPHAGSGKQRLARQIGVNDAHQIADALLSCALEDVADWPGPVVISPALEADHEWADTLLPGAAVLVQPEGNLGQRLQHVDELLRQRGDQQRIFIGTDAPLLDKQTLMQAADALQTHDVVLQPARDGGVTLMATGPAWPQLLDLPWSQADLGLALQAACLLAGHDVWLLQAGMDVDLLADLHSMQQLLENDHRSARQDLLQAIDAILEQGLRSKSTG